MGHYLNKKIDWEQTEDPYHPFVAESEGNKYEIRLNDFPAENLYTLIVNGKEEDTFDDWSENWSRPSKENFLNTSLNKFPSISEQQAFLPDLDSGHPIQLPFDSKNSDPILITTPSKAYKHATASLVYRLSETMFGSLLATYVLGFLGLVFTQFQTQESVLITVFLTLQYISISVTFPYLTASLYLSYHGGVLTMPTRPLKYLSFDFLLSLAQAIFFGLSMVKPRMFPILLGFIIWAVIYRQRKEFIHLIKGLRDYAVKNSKNKDMQNSMNEGPTDLDEEFENFKKEILTYLKDHPILGGWKPVRKWLWSYAIILVVGGGLVWYLNEMWKLPTSLQLPLQKIEVSQEVSEAVVAFECIVIAVAVFWIGRKIISTRAKLSFNDVGQMDDPYNKLLVKSKEFYENRS